jgi:phosphatidylglycerophosphatase A
MVQSIADPTLARRVWGDPLVFLACGLGTGLSPVAPGTFGTLLGLPLFWILGRLPPAGYLLAVALLFVLGIGLCRRAARVLKRADPPQVVWDEVVGYLVTLFAAPAGWMWMVVGFVAFRLCDILKPWPASWLDRRCHGGFGIMADDLVAGLYAWGMVQLLGMYPG